MAQVNAIGKDLQIAEDEALNARQRVVLVNKSLQRNEYRLHLAKGNLKKSQKRLMTRLYSLYTSSSPSTIELLAGAHSFGQILDRVETAQAISNQDAALGRQALSFEHAVQAREQQLKQLKQRREQALREKNAKRAQVAAELGQQKRLLASIHSSISQLQAQEAARERAAAAAAAARLKAELAAAAARKKAEQQQAQASSSSSSSPTIAPPPPVSVPTGGTGAGHPAAASIALHYLGVPYRYGGASPSGFDCSGLVMYVYAQLGISLPHYTVAQWNATQPISSPAPGDLVFFNGLGHVGIYIGGGKMVDAPHTGSVVRIDSIAGFGGYDGARRVP
jgi:cell wall-associated NlpC family hydrolase